MNLKSRVEKLEGAGIADEGRVRFRVIVPPKMTREEWAAHVREMQACGSRFFTVDLTGAASDE